MGEGEGRRKIERWKREWGESGGGEEEEEEVEEEREREKRHKERGGKTEGERRSKRGGERTAPAADLTQIGRVDRRRAVQCIAALSEKRLESVCEDADGDEGVPGRSGSHVSVP